MSTIVKFAATVGVAPGTTTIKVGNSQLGSYWDPYQDMVQLTGLGKHQISAASHARVMRALRTSGMHKRPGMRGFGAPRTAARIRWDLIGLVGGGSLIIALTAGLIASSIK